MKIKISELVFVKSDKSIQNKMDYNFILAPYFTSYLVPFHKFCESLFDVVQKAIYQFLMVNAAPFPFHFDLVVTNHAEERHTSPSTRRWYWFCDL